jgi:hypothetical protein
LRNTLDNVDQTNITQLFRGEPVSSCRTNVAGADNCDLISRTHELIPFGEE